MTRQKAARSPATQQVRGLGGRAPGSTAPALRALLTLPLYPLLLPEGRVSPRQSAHEKCPGPGLGKIWGFSKLD